MTDNIIVKKFKYLTHTTAQASTSVVPNTSDSTSTVAQNTPEQTTTVGKKDLSSNYCR